MAVSLNRRPLLPVLIGGLAAPLVVAVPAGGHELPAGGVVDGLAHPLLGIDHLLAMVAVGVLAALAGSRRAAWGIPVGFVGGMVAGGLLGLAGVPLPGVELMIAASVVVLGALVITRAVGATPWLVGGATALGALHGHAHGAEIPTHAIPVLYVAGFVVATAGLRAVGAGAGIGMRRAPAVRAAAGALISAAGVLLLVGGA